MDRRISPDYSKLIGVPYEKMNCWELVREFYSKHLGVELKHYANATPKSREEIQNLIYTNRGEFDEVDLPCGLKFGDILLFKIRGIESHIGVYTETGRFLHSTKATGSVIDRTDRWTHVFVAAYRIREKAA